MTEVDDIKIQNYLDAFRKWIYEQRSILNSPDTDEFLLRFLRVTDFHLNKAKEWLIHFWKYRTENSKWFTNRDLLKNPLMREIAETAYCLQLPKETKDKQLVFLMRVGHFDAKKYTLDDVTRYAFAVTDILNTQSAAQIYGYIILLDLSDMRLQHVLEFTPDHARRYVDCWEKMYPARLCQIHFYNYPSLFDPVLYLFRLFFHQKLNDKILFHSNASADLMNKSLHKYIHPSLLPNEYGGQLGSIEGEMNRSFIQWTREHNDYMIQLDQYGIDLQPATRLLKTLKSENDS